MQQALKYTKFNIKHNGELIHKFNIFLMKKEMLLHFLSFKVTLSQIISL